MHRVFGMALQPQSSYSCYRNHHVGHAGQGWSHRPFAKISPSTAHSSEIHTWAAPSREQMPPLGAWYPLGACPVQGYLGNLFFGSRCMMGILQTVYALHLIRQVRELLAKLSEVECNVFTGIFRRIPKVTGPIYNNWSPCLIQIVIITYLKRAHSRTESICS